MPDAVSSCETKDPPWKSGNGKEGWCRTSQFGRMQQALEAEVVLVDVVVLVQKSDRLPKSCFVTSVKNVACGWAVVQLDYNQEEGFCHGSKGRWAITSTTPSKHGATSVLVGMICSTMWTRMENACVVSQIFCLCWS